MRNGRVEAGRDAEAAVMMLDYLQSILGFSREFSLAIVRRFVVAPTPRDMRIFREEVERWRLEERQGA